eukprot:RCo019516
MAHLPAPLVTALCPKPPKTPSASASPAFSLLYLVLRRSLPFYFAFPSLPSSFDCFSHPHLLLSFQVAPSSPFPASLVQRTTSEAPLTLNSNLPSLPSFHLLPNPFLPLFGSLQPLKTLKKKPPSSSKKEQNPTSLTETTPSHGKFLLSLPIWVPLDSLDPRHCLSATGPSPSLTSPILRRLPSFHPNPLSLVRTTGGGARCTLHRTKLSPGVYCTSLLSSFVTFWDCSAVTFSVGRKG